MRCALWRIAPGLVNAGEKTCWDRANVRMQVAGTIKTLPIRAGTAPLKSAVGGWGVEANSSPKLAEGRSSDEPEHLGPVMSGGPAGRRANIFD